jgi:hypothetical protein
MPKRGDVHVTYRPREKKWSVEVEGQGRSSGLRATQREAVALGREIAKRNGSELLVHRKDDARIRERDSHGTDPRSIRG